MRAETILIQLLNCDYAIDYDYAIQLTTRRPRKQYEHEMRPYPRCPRFLLVFCIFYCACAETGKLYKYNPSQILRAVMGGVWI